MKILKVKDLLNKGYIMNSVVGYDQDNKRYVTKLCISSEKEGVMYPVWLDRAINYEDKDMMNAIEDMAIAIGD